MAIMSSDQSNQECLDKAIASNVADAGASDGWQGAIMMLTPPIGGNLQCFDLFINMILLSKSNRLRERRLKGCATHILSLSQPPHRWLMVTLGANDRGSDRNGLITHQACKNPITRKRH